MTIVPNFIACSLKDLQNIFMQSLPLHASCLFSMLLNNDFTDIDKTDGICWFCLVLIKL